MKIITAPEEYVKQSKDICVFLAGGITNCRDWQKEVIQWLNDKTYQCDNEHLVIFNPRRENFPIHDKSAAYEQIEWEFRMLEQCDIFSMYFCNADSDQPICMYELGRNIVRIQNRFPSTWLKRIIVTVEEDYKREEDVLVQTNLAMGGRINNVNVYFNKNDSIIYHSNGINLLFKRLRDSK